MTPDYIKPAAHRLVWIAAQKEGGVRTYSDRLWPSVKKACEDAGFAYCTSLTEKLQSPADVRRLIGRLKDVRPTLIHFQHEYGLFGGTRVPFFYLFPKVVSRIQEEFPLAKVVATAHTVISPEFKYPRHPLDGRGWAMPARVFANQFLLPVLHNLWNPETWGELNGVIVHSKAHVDRVRQSGCHKVEVIPHFVPDLDGDELGREPEPEWLKSIPPGRPVVMVFGYLCPEKGQDIAIEAISRLKAPVTLVLAGGVRRRADKAFQSYCRKLAKELSVEAQVVESGFIPGSRLGAAFKRATLILMPSREMPGAGSLAQAMAGGAPVLASDLPLNREVVERVPDAMTYFKSEDVEDCANQIDRLLGDEGARAKLAAGAAEYAARHDLKPAVRRHVEFYSSL